MECRCLAVIGTVIQILFDLTYGLYNIIIQYIIYMQILYNAFVYELKMLQKMVICVHQKLVPRLCRPSRLALTTLLGMYKDVSAIKTADSDKELLTARRNFMGWKWGWWGKELSKLKDPC